jgi:hypothetical protein
MLWSKFSTNEQHQLMKDCCTVITNMTLCIHTVPMSSAQHHLIIYITYCKYHCIYEGYPESKFQWAIKKKREYITNPVYCHLMYTLYTTFWHSFHHCWGTCHSVAPVLYPFIIEWCRLRCKVRGNGFFYLVVIVEPLASKERFQMQEQMKITWR